MGSIPRGPRFDPRSDLTFQKLSNLLGMTLQYTLEKPYTDPGFIHAVLRIRIRLDPFHFGQPDPDPLQ